MHRRRRRRDAPGPHRSTAGTVVFTAVNLGVQTEYIATAGSAQSNAIALAPIRG